MSSPDSFPLTRVESEYYSSFPVYHFSRRIGYNDSRKIALGDTLADRVMCQVEREVSHSSSSDAPSLFVVIHSLSGGTGSGNSYLLVPKLVINSYSGLGSRIISYL